MTPVVRTHASRAELEDALVDTLMAVLTAAADESHEGNSAQAAPFAVMLSGGSTPLPAYRRVAAQSTRARPGLHLLFSDDRYVPATAAASNYFQMRSLIDALKLDDAHVFRVRTELSLDEAAMDYARQLESLAQQHIPIPLALVGLGADGHTCSLFSKTDLERSRSADAIAVARPDGLEAVSVTPRVLERADRVVFVVSGKDKQTAVRNLLEGDASQTAWNAVSGCRHVEVWGDRDALALSFG